jgi:hypothetical protein
VRSGGEFFVRRRRPQARPADAADEPVTFPIGGSLPGWATGTGLFAAIGDKSLRPDPA